MNLAADQSPANPAPPVSAAALPPAEIRPATTADLPAIVRIRNTAIEHSTALWTHELIDLTIAASWLARAESAGHLLAVATVEGTVVAYASYGPWRAYSGYRLTVDDSIYIDEGHHGRGIGLALMTTLISHARGAGLHLMIADIEAGNTASIRLHERVGFEVTGTIRQIGTKFGQWLDLTIMSLRLNDADAPPVSPPYR